MPLALDWLEIGLLIAINAIVDTLLVAYVAGLRSKKALVEYLNSPESDVLWDKQARKVVEVVQPAVDTRLGRFEAVIRAEMPHPDVQVADMKAEIATKLDAMDRGLTAALQQVDSSFARVIGAMGGAEQELRKELALVSEEGQSAIEEAVAQADISNPVVRRLYAWAAKPVDPKLEAKNPIGAAALQLGKAALLERLQGADLAGGTRSYLKRTANWSPGLK